MRSKLLVPIFVAVAFCCAFFGATAVAKASPASSVSSSAPQRNVAPPGTYAASFGAPLCDDRAASAYAAEPKPAPVEAGEVASDDTCRTGGAALHSSAATPAQGDDLNRVQPTARDLAILPAAIDLPRIVVLVAVLDHEVTEGARDGYSLRDNPPPRPIPWRS